MQPEHRLRASADFERARRRGRSWGNALLVLHAVRGAEARTRCGFAVSRRVGKAVVRNRVRRRLREIMRRRLADAPAGWDLVLTARPAAAGAPYAELAGAADDLLRRASLAAPTFRVRAGGEPPEET
jgi:ribonuclease P protein component